MARTSYSASFPLARDNQGLRVTQLGNGAIVKDSLVSVGKQEAVQVQVDGYFSKDGLDYLISHLESIKRGLITNG